MAYDRFGDEADRELRIVLLGAAGSGKSKTGNMLLGSNDYFEVGCYSNRTIVKSSFRYGTHLKIVDTPGLFGLRNVNIDLELDSSLHLTIPGPHMFIVCVPMGRLTDQASKAVKTYVEYFGENIYEFLTIAFTYLDQWEDDIRDRGVEPDFDGYLRTLPYSMKHILQRCENRFCVINNRKHGNENEKQAKHVIERIIECISKKHEKGRIFKRSDGFCMSVWLILKQIGVGIRRFCLSICIRAHRLFQ